MDNKTINRETARQIILDSRDIYFADSLNRNSRRLRRINVQTHLQERRERKLTASVKGEQKRTTNN